MVRIESVLSKNHVQDVVVLEKSPVFLPFRTFSVWVCESQRAALQWDGVVAMWKAHPCVCV